MSEIPKYDDKHSVTDAKLNNNESYSNSKSGMNPEAKDIIQVKLREQNMHGIEEKNGNLFKEDKVLISSAKYKNDEINLDSRKIFINLTQKNIDKYHFTNNFVKTSKYELYDFAPKCLLIQFRRYANIYFLLIAVLQSIPFISPLTPATAIAPLVFVLLVSMVREGFEDYTRHKSDEKENMEKVMKYDNEICGFRLELSKNLEVGELIKVEEYGIIPADILLLSCSHVSKMAYIETANLDGEKNLKPRYCIPEVFHMFKDSIEVMRIRGKILCDKPNSDLGKFNGRLKLSMKNEYTIGIKQFLYKGTILKNTKWVVGVVVYTGKETKIVLNSQKGSGKISHVESQVNGLIGMIFIFQLSLCVVMGILSGIWSSNNSTKHSYLSISDNSIVVGIVSFFGYILLLNTMIPISLIVSIEIVKYFQGYFMNNDVLMYSKSKEKFVKVNSCSLNEELGQIKYIFSDKTGTLTANKLEFKACAIGDELYGITDEILDDSLSKNVKRKITHKTGGVGLKYLYGFPTDLIKNFTSKRQPGKPYNGIQIASTNNVANLKIENQRDVVEQFFLNLTVNQTCFVEIPKKNKVKVSRNYQNSSSPNLLNDENKKSEPTTNDVVREEDAVAIKYKGENPDEIVFVDASRHLGVVYYGGDETVCKLKLMRQENGGNAEIGEDLTVNIKKVLEFSSARGMMSTIAVYNKRLILYSKGGDTKLEPLLAKDKQQPFYKKVKDRSYKLALKGYRVLWIAMRMIEDKEFDDWNVDFEKGLKTLTDEKKINDYKKKKYQLIENGLILIGCTAVEDRLQTNVPETIKELQTAGVNVWVLTGDNLATAKNIGIMCNLLPKNMDIYEINDDINKFMQVANPNNDPNVFTEEKIAVARNKIRNFEQKYQEVYQDTNTEEYLDKKSKVCVGLENMLIRYKTSEENNKGILRGVLVESDMLRMLLPNENFTDVKYYAHPLAKYFLDLTLDSQAIICCRVAPKQKALVVRMIKKNIEGAITLSIGDGANDVSMIIEADVGVGIFGEEGTQAAMSSDYAIGEFQCIKRLILVHGRLNYIRIAEMILYFFYKNFIFTIPQFFYGFFSAYSGQTVFDDYYVSFYNMVFTALPLLFKALLDKDLIDFLEEFPEEKQKIEKNNLLTFVSDLVPYTYYIGRESTIFGYLNFLLNILLSLVHSVLLFFCIYFYLDKSPLNSDGYNSDLWIVSITQFTAVMMMVNFRLLVSQRHHTSWNTWVIIITSYLIYFLYIIVSSWLSISKTTGTIPILLSYANFYLSIILIGCIAFLFDLMLSSYFYNFVDNPTNLIRRFVNFFVDSDETQLKENKKECKEKILDFDDNMKPVFKVKRVVIQEEEDEA